MHMNEAMLYQHIMDVWFVDGAQDTRCIVTGDKFALVPRDTQKRMMTSAKTQVEELANKYKYSHDVSMDKQLLQVKLHPVDKKVIIKRIQKAYPELRDIAIKFTWQCPKKDEFERILTSHHMNNVRPHTWIYHPTYKQPKSIERVPFNPAPTSPRTCLNPVGEYVYGSEVHKWGYHNIETCLRLCHRHLPVWIPREIWNGIIRLALYYHAGEVLSKIFKLPTLDITFEKIITMSRP